MKEPKKDKVSFKNRINHFLELPKEIVLNLPLISIVGNEEITIENYKGVIEYSPEKIRVNTSCGVFKIEGRNLLLKQITSEAITVTGLVSKFEYIM